MNNQHQCNEYKGALRVGVCRLRVQHSNKGSAVIKALKCRKNDQVQLAPPHLNLIELFLPTSMNECNVH